MTIFEMPKLEALQKLTQLEKSRKLADYIKTHHPEYLLPDGKPASFLIAIKLGLLGSEYEHGLDLESLIIQKYGE